MNLDYRERNVEMEYKIKVNAQEKYKFVSKVSGRHENMEMQLYVDDHKYWDISASYKYGGRGAQELRLNIDYINFSMKSYLLVKTCLQYH